MHFATLYITVNEGWLVAGNLHHSLWEAFLFIEVKLGTQAIILVGKSTNHYYKSASTILEATLWKMNQQLHWEKEKNCQNGSPGGAVCWPIAQLPLLFPRSFWLSFWANWWIQLNNPIPKCMHSCTWLKLSNTASFGDYSTRKDHPIQ